METVSTLTARELDELRLKATRQPPLSHMRPKWITYQELKQAELEARGRWLQADILNAWLAGALISEMDCLEGREPLMRIQFLERMQKALQPLSPESQHKAG